MQVQLESTTKIVELIVDGHPIKARVWEGTTAAGIRCHAFITRIAVKTDDDRTEFERDLKEHAAPTPEIQAIPLRFIL